MAIDWTGIILLILSYLLGSVPFGYLIVRWMKGVDIRRIGSGNIGATNVMRTSGRWGGILTLLLDGAKGYLTVWTAERFVEGNQLVVGLAAVAVVLGHVFPVFLKFRGGKGVATAAGVFLKLGPLSLLASLAVFVILVAVWRFISLGSMVSACAFCFMYFLLDYRRGHSIWPLMASVVCACLIIIRHKENIQRLVAGTENRFPGSRK